MDGRGHLLRVLGLAFGLAAVIGSVVGQGILRAPGIVAQASGSEWVLLALWLAGGLLALLAALPLAELGAALPSAGGIITFAGRAFGPGMRVIAAFTMLLMQVTAAAVVAFVAGELLVRLGVGGDVFGWTVGPSGLAIALLAGLLLVNTLGTQVNGMVQVGLSAFKGAALIALVVALFAQPGAAPPPEPSAIAPAGWLAFGTAMLVIIGSYNGWGDVVVYGEEIDDPGRNLPRSLFGGIAGVMVLYLAVNLALFHAMTPAALARSDFPAADALGSTLGANADLAFTLFGVVSIGALCSLGVMSTGRIAYAAARDRILPRWFDKVRPNGAPLRAMTLVCAVATAFLWSGSYLALSSTSVALSQATMLLFALCSIALMRREPGLHRPFRIRAYWPVMALVVGFDALLLAIIIAQDPWFSLAGFVLVGALAGGYRLLGPRMDEAAIEEREEAWISPD
ncbi:MAG: APC family permease [Altererythrobacter sp.]|nr:APC family permease [Altererythrobacter sp.]